MYLIENHPPSDCAHYPGSTTLETEIQRLRFKMEQVFEQEKSFTADLVVEISSLLDVKINEYMKTRKL